MASGAVLSKQHRVGGQDGLSPGGRANTPTETKPVKKSSLSKADSAKKTDGDDKEDPRKKFDPKAPKKYKAWDKEEMLLLRKGVQKHGVGSWETIRQDPEFKLLQLRTGVQIKDKWRNLVKFRHLSDEEREAAANRTSKVTKRSAVRSNSFSAGGNASDKKQDSSQLSWAQAQNLAQTSSAVPSTTSIGQLTVGQSQRLQGLQDYAKAHQDRLQAEEDFRQAQAAYDNASLQLNGA
eukprot:scaffold192690_cov40-Prasinocladus_malaysianus.AAC.1